MFFRTIVPRALHRLRCSSHSCCPRRWMGGRRDVPIVRPWARSCDPWDMRRGFRNPFGMLSRVERDFDDMWRAMNEMWAPRYRQRYPGRESNAHTPEIQVNYNDKTFELYLKVDKFTPEELEVKVVDGQLMISGKHTEKPDEHGSITREFTRYIRIPEDVDPDTIMCDLSDEGQLAIQGNIRRTTPSSERVINIEKKKSVDDQSKTEPEGSQN